MLEQAITEAIVKQLGDEIKQQLNLSTANIVQVNLINDDTEELTFSGEVHHKFRQVLSLVNENIPVLLVGGAGSGKSTCARQISEALNLNFYFSNAITQEYKLTGFIDANGNYHETEFYKAFTEGGLFLLDELDASIPEALIILNNAISNGYFDFPTGRKDRHSKFRVIACANTYGTGLDATYVGRNQLDGATLDRLVPLEFNYDTELEKSLSDNKEWVEFVQFFRWLINDKGIQHIVSTRAIIYGTALLKSKYFSNLDVIKQVLFKNLTFDELMFLKSHVAPIYIKEENTYYYVFMEFLENNTSTDE